jgi:hypothetical protein
MEEEPEPFDFSSMEKYFDDIKVALDGLAEISVPMFLAYKKRGLSARDAATLTAATLAQWSPPVEPPTED